MQLMGPDTLLLTLSLPSIAPMNLVTTVTARAPMQRPGNTDLQHY